MIPAARCFDGDSSKRLKTGDSEVLGQFGAYQKRMSGGLAGQCAENAHSQICKQQGSRLRCWHTATEQQEVKICTLSIAHQHYIPLRLSMATRVLILTFRTQMERNFISVWLSQPIFFRQLNLREGRTTPRSY